MDGPWIQTATSTLTGSPAGGVVVPPAPTPVGTHDAAAPVRLEAPATPSEAESAQ